MPAPSNLDLGRLLRVQAMVRESQVEATHAAADALVRAYLSLREEMHTILASEDLKELQLEFQRLFERMDDPVPFIPLLNVETGAKRESAAYEALVNLRKLSGWIQGLIDELTFEQRLRIEAEEKAKAANRPGVGFGP
jgi:hypothetical protein